MRNILNPNLVYQTAPVDRNCISCVDYREVVDAEEFLTLAPEQVAKLICSDRLMVPSEEKVFECVISWVHHDLEKRQNNLALLMEHVRLPLLSQEYLVQRVEEEPLLKANLQCKLLR